MDSKPEGAYFPDYMYTVFDDWELKRANILLVEMHISNNAILEMGFHRSL